MQVRQCVTANPIAVSPMATGSDAFRWMRLMELHALPTSTALLSVYEIDRLFGEMKVEKVMTRNVISVSEDCPPEEAARILIDYQIHSLPVTRGQTLVGMIAQSDLFQVMTDALGGRSEGWHVTIQLREDKGELGSITDGIIHLDGTLVGLYMFWGNDPFHGFVTLKVQGVKREDLLLLLERTIGVEVMDFRESHAAAKSGAGRPIANKEAIPISNLHANIPWPVESK